MPTVLRVGRFRIVIFLPPREHEPPHVHVRTADGEVVIELAGTYRPQTVRSVAKMRSSDVTAAFWIVEEHAQYLVSVGGNTMAKPRTAKAKILAQLSSARAREARDRRSGRRATSVTYDRRTGRIMMELTSGFVFGFPAKAIPALAKATPGQLAAVTLSPGGSGLHWDELDADLSVPGLLLSSIDRSEQLSELARVAGRVRSPAKAAAARTNGAKGGRPRKAAGR